MSAAAVAAGYLYASGRLRGTRPERKREEQAPGPVVTYRKRRYVPENQPLPLPKKEG